MTLQYIMFFINHRILKANFLWSDYLIYKLFVRSNPDYFQFFKLCNIKILLLESDLSLGSHN